MLQRPGLRVSSIVVLLGASVAPGVAMGQDVTAAAKAFGAGQQAELAHEWDRAAEFYELADRIAPSPQALRSSAKSHLAAGDHAAAATQAEELLRRYPDEAASTALAAGILQQTVSHLSRWDITCSPSCTVAIDGGAVVTEPRSSHTIYSAPGDHRIEAFFSGNRSNVTNVSGVEGGRKDIPFEPAPAAPSKPPETVGDTAAPSDQAHPGAPSESDAPSGLSPAVALAGLGVTAVLGALTVWSGLDTLNARDEFVTHPSQRGYDDGVSLERRTNVLIGATAVAGAATLGIALFATRWQSAKEKDAPSPASAFPVTFVATPQAAALLVRGSF